MGWTRDKEMKWFQVLGIPQYAKWAKMCVESLVTVFVSTYHTERCYVLSISSVLQHEIFCLISTPFLSPKTPGDRFWTLFSRFPSGLVLGRFFADVFCKPIRRLSCSLDLISSIRKQLKVEVDVDSASSNLLSWPLIIALK